MSNVKNFDHKKAIDKLKSLVHGISIHLFCSDPKTDEGFTSRPMSAIKVCDQGNMWFFSEKDSDKNKAIDNDENMQLFFSHPAKGSFLVVNGEEEIILDKSKIEEMWTSAAKIWFEEGKDDPNIAIIKVIPTTEYYWDTNGNRMINFIKMVASVVTGTNLLNGEEGLITL